jgi:hypothetical protein
VTGSRLLIARLVILLVPATSIAEDLLTRRIRDAVAVELRAPTPRSDGYRVDGSGRTVPARARGLARRLERFQPLSVPVPGVPLGGENRNDPRPRMWSVEVIRMPLTWPPKVSLPFTPRRVPAGVR